MSASPPTPAPRPPIRSAHDFWGEFQRRAPGLDREPLARPSHQREWLAAAAALVVGAGALAMWMWPAESHARTTEVISLDVPAPHDSVFLMPMEGGGVMVWIGMEEPPA